MYVKLQYKVFRSIWWLVVKQSDHERRLVGLTASLLHWGMLIYNFFKKVLMSPVYIMTWVIKNIRDVKRNVFMRRRFTISSAFLDIKNNTHNTHNQILDIKKYLINSKTAPQNTFLDIKKSRFLDIKKWFLDIKNSIFWYQEMCIISWYQEIEFLISRIIILDIKKSISWYQEIEFLISRNIFYFLISRNRILDIKNSISWYQKIFLDIKNSFLDIKKNSWYQEMLNK